MRRLKELGKLSLAMLMVLAMVLSVIPATCFAAGVSTSVTPTYTTVTEGYDWGPAITKVILNIGTTLKQGAVSKDTFVAKSERIYRGIDWSTFDWATFKGVYKDFDETAVRNITDAYVSDEFGNTADSGSYVTITMEVGPTLSAGSPFNYDPLTGFNNYVNTYYLVSVKDGQSIVGQDNTSVIMSETNKAGNKGNTTLGVDGVFDLTGKSTYTDTTFGAIKLNYASYSPSADSRKNPLIIWLHGAGEGGTDVTLPLIASKVYGLAGSKIQGIFDGAYVLVPQSDTMWMNDGTGAYTSDGTSKYTRALMNLIQTYVTANPDIDASKIYIGGCSNGGFMSMNMIMNYPDYFAAAFPVCEAYQDSLITDTMLANIVNIPIWFTQAATDSTVNPTFTTIPTYQRLITAGAYDVHFTLWDSVLDTTGLYKKADGSPYEYNGHFSWVYMLNDQCEKDYDGSAVIVNGKAVTLLKWLATQSKNETLKFKTSDISIIIGKSSIQAAKVFNGKGTEVSYTSSDASIASVDSKTGIVTAIDYGTATITAVLADNSDIAASYTVTVIPAKTTISSICSSKKNTVVIAWRKANEATGYKVYMSTTSATEGFKLVKTIKSGSTLTYTKTGLTSGTNVYFKVVTYGTSGSITYVSADSNVKTVKVK